jgi:hypothetical protein
MMGVERAFPPDARLLYVKDVLQQQMTQFCRTNATQVITILRSLLTKQL